MDLRKSPYIFLSLLLGLTGCGTSYEGTLLPIQGTDYERYFIVQGVDQNYISTQIHEYGDLWGTENQTSYTFDFATLGDWEIVKVDSELPFYQYHNLITWFLGDGTQNQTPSLSIGLALDQTSTNQNYVAFMDPNSSWGDTQIALFEDGKEAFIYLPEAYEKEGNLKILENKISPFPDLKAYLVDIDFDVSLLQASIEFESEEILLETIE